MSCYRPVTKNAHCLILLRPKGILRRLKTKKENKKDYMDREERTTSLVLNLNPKPLSNWPRDRLFKRWITLSSG